METVSYVENIHSSFNQTLSSLTRSLKGFGYPIPTQSLSTTQKLKEVPAEFKSSLIQGLNSYLSLIETPLPGLHGRSLDLAHFDIFLRATSLKLIDPGIMRYFEEGDICEVYSTDHRQIFRTLEFFRLCKYDLGTLMTTPWNQLFLRPDSIQAQMLNLAEIILLKSIPSIVDPIPTHVIQECYGGQNQPYVYSTKFAGCIVDSFTEAPKGYVTIIRVQKLHKTAHLDALS